MFYHYVSLSYAGNKETPRLCHLIYHGISNVAKCAVWVSVR